MRALRRPIQYSAKHTLEILEKQLERIDTSSALGMWEFASYVISSSPVVANNVAHMYLALTQGEGSFISSAAVHLWDGEEEKDQAATILERIRKITHHSLCQVDSAGRYLLYRGALSAECSGQ